MEIVTDKQDGKNILQVSGRLDANTSPELEKKLLSMLDDGEKDYIADLAGLEYISSVGLRVLLMAAKKAKSAGGKVVLSNLNEHVHEVFEIAGFTAIFPIFASLDEALTNY
jgi:anti-sigma B factor antagonist